MSNDNCVFRLQDKSQKDIVSLIVLEKCSYNGVDFYEEKWAYSKYKQRQLLSYLFDLILIEFGYSVLSDSIHTSPGSKEFWLSLGRKKKYSLYIYKISTDYKRKYENYPIQKIWGFETDITDEETKEYVFQDLYDRRLISEDIYNFLMDNLSEIKDRSDVRLLIEKL